VVDRRGTGQCVDGRDDGRADARPTEHEPTTLPARRRAVVDPHAGARVGHRGHVGYRSPGAAEVRLPDGLDDNHAAAAARTAPGCLSRIARTGVSLLIETGAADGSHIPRSGRKLDPVTVVAGTDRNGDAVVVIERRVVEILADVFGTAVTIADGKGAQARRGVDGRTQVDQAVRVRLNQRDVAQRADGAHHIQVERDFLGPTGIHDGIRSCQTCLVQFAETAVGAGAGWQWWIPVVAIHRQVVFGGRVIERIDDGNYHTSAGLACDAGQVVRRL